MIRLVRLDYMIIMFSLCIGCFLTLNQSVASTTNSFNYGQCLTERAAFNQELRNYNQAALMTASIKAFALKKNPNLLKWDYETVKFIYNLNLVKVFFETLVDVYNDQSHVELKSEFENYLTGVNGNNILQQLQSNNPYEDTDTLTSFKEFLSKPDSRKSAQLHQKYQTILKYLNAPLRAQALAELYGVVQSASITLDFLSLRALEQWLALFDVFFEKRMIKSFLVEAYIKSPVKIINNKPSPSGILFSEEEYNQNPVWKSELPPLMNESYPRLSSNHSEAQKLIKYLYSRTIEDFLFSMNAIDYTTVEQWMIENNIINSVASPSATTSHLPLKSDPSSTAINGTASRENTNNGMILPRAKPERRKKGKVVKKRPVKSTNPNAAIYYSVLQQAQVDEKSKSEPTDAKKVFAYLANQERVYSNAFDNFVWHKQEGTPTEKSIDGIARTLYSEAESCQKLDDQNQQGVHQFEAMGLAIAHRAISIEKENRLMNFYTSTPNPQESSNPESDYFSTSPNVSDYYGAVRDFGRNGEVMRHPIVSEMPTPAQVVSKPVHFSVWKIAKTESISATKWIPELSSLGYPNDFKVAIASSSKSTMDNAQFKALCPTAYPEVFKHALGVASQIVSNPYDFVRRYQLYEYNKKGGRYVTPYFFTHGPKTKLGAKNRSFAKVALVDAYTKTKDGKPTPLRMIDSKDNINCRTFKLYGAHEKHQWNKTLVNQWNNKGPFSIY